MTWLSNEALAHLREVADWPDLSATKYEVVSVLGQGGMATVYLARDKDLGREVALKVMRLPEPAQGIGARLEQEARILARLEHPGLVPVHDMGTLPDGRVFYAMKRVRGRRLDEHLREARALAERLRLFERICETVAFAHAQGVIHRDLKPANVMVGPFGEVLVLDWGIAKLRDEELRDGGPGGSQRVAPAASLPATAHGAIVGTMGYMSPEQASGLPVDARADVFALGRILESMAAVPEADADGPARVLRPLASILAKALAPEADRRYPGARELGDDVARYLSGLRVLAHEERWFEVIGRLALKYRTPLGLILAYVLVRVALIFWRAG
jgi:eukaryotic-like serine/threonine-protein kinase